MQIPGIPSSLPARALAMIQQLLALKAADPRIRVKRITAREMLGGVGETTELKMERVGDLDIVLDHGIVWVMVSSIYDKLIADVVKTYSAGDDTPKAFDPRRRLIQKKPKRPRPRSPAQLAALARTNEERHREKLMREKQESVSQ
jgi:hypothetical protein